MDLGTVLVVGGCGFVGHHIVRRLLEEPSCEMVAVVSRDPNHNLFPGVSYHAGDITSPTGMRTLLAEIKPRVIIHTASPISTDKTFNAHLLEQVNIEGTKNLLACAADAPSVLAFVFCSSTTVVSAAGFEALEEKDAPLLASRSKHDYYAYTKAIADQLVLAGNNRKPGNEGGLRTLCLRPAGIIGEGDVQVLAGMIHLVDNGTTNFQLGDNTTYFDFVYVGNVADAHILAAKALLKGIVTPTTPKVDGEPFFITNEEPMLMWEFMRKVWAEAGDRTPIEKVWIIPRGVALAFGSVAEWTVWLLSCGTRRPKSFTRQSIDLTVTTRTYSIQKAKERLGYVPRVSLEEGVRKGVAWTFEQRPKRKEVKEKRV